MKRTLGVVAACLALVLAGTMTAQAANPAGRAAGGGIAVLTNPDEGLHIAFSFSVWEASGTRPEGGFSRVRVFETGRMSSGPASHVRVEGNRVAWVVCMDGDYYYVLHTDGGPPGAGLDTIQNALAEDEQQAIEWVESMYVPSRTWTVMTGEIRVSD